MEFGAILKTFLMVISKTKAQVFIAFISIVIFAWFYYILANKYSDVSENKRYRSLLNKPITLIQDAILIENSDTEFLEEYPFEMENFTTIDTSRPDYTVIPKGTNIYFQKVMKVNKAVSGSQYICMFSSFVNPKTNKTTKFVYQWGTFQDICIDSPCNYWVLRKAPWQVKKDTTRYFD
jgi:hypothetical protein